LTRVIPNGQGICPACKKVVHDVAGVDTTRTAMPIRPHDTLPPICFHCAATASCVYRVTRRRSENMDDAAAEKRGLLQALAAIAGMFIFFRATGETLSLALPMCDHCAASIKPVPLYVDFAKESMTFAVDKQFKTAAVR